MKRRSDSSSATKAVQAMAAAARGLPPVPKHVRLRPEDMPFWRDILRSKAADEWDDSSLVAAAQLARVQRDIETESALLEAESLIVQSSRGTPMANPRALIVDQLVKRSLALRRSLRLGGRAARGDPRDAVNLRKLERESRRLHEELLAGEDDLLA